MEHLFNYTRQLASNVNSLIEDIAVLQRILKEKKNASLTKEKIESTLKEVKKKTYFLRVLEHISYLENFKNDIKRAISALDHFVKDRTYSRTEIKKIQTYLSTICVTYPEEREEVKAIAPLSLSAQTIERLEGTMKVTEEILLSHYGLTSPVVDLEEKLVKSIETLFTLPLEELTAEEKNLIEEFFTHIQNAFEAKGTEGWESAYIKCTAIMNNLKILAGMDPTSTLDITIEEVDKEDEPEEE
jgi:ElaB/YqjD/DUF883 family membrane-anchored ribosome-binding protein